MKQSNPILKHFTTGQNINRYIAILAIACMVFISATEKESPVYAESSSSLFTEPFLGQIALFGFNFAPPGWAKCEGQLLPISSNSALFSLLGTTYGGDGETTFGLPDLRGRVPIGEGQGPGLPSYSMGEKVGNTNTILSTLNLPPHNHSASIGGTIKIPVSSDGPDTDDPSGAFITSHNDDHFGSSPSPGEFFGDLENNLNVTVNNNGAGQQFTNMQPSLSMNYCIALVGLFPSPN